MKYTFSHNGTHHTIDLSSSGDGYEVRAGDSRCAFRVVERGGGAFDLVFPDRTVALETAADGDVRWVALNGRTYELRREARSRKGSDGGSEASEGALRAPMPGQVRAINVAAGDSVGRGEVLLVLEAMKMEIKIQSPFDGTVGRLPVSEGQQVDKGQVIVEVMR